MLLTVAIHADRPDYKLCPLLNLLYRQIGCDLDVCVVSTFPARDLEEAQHQYPIISYDVPPGTSTAAMLNEAFSRSKGSVIATLAASWMPRDERWAQNLTRHFVSQTIAAVSGSDFNTDKLSIQHPWYSQDLLDFLTEPEYSLNFNNAAIRKDLWRQQAFDASNFVCADKHWSYRMLQAGYQIVMDYETRCHTGEAPSQEALFKRYWAMNLSFGSFLHAQNDIKQLGMRALTQSWRKRSFEDLARLYRLWPLIKSKRYWQRDPAHAMLAREHFVRAGGKWAT